MSTATKRDFRKDSWQTPGNARTLRAFMALRNQEIGQRLRDLRASQGNPPQEIVAHKIGISARSYGAWESGETKPSYRSLSRLAEFYGTTEHFILAGNGEGDAEPDAPEPSQLERIELALAENGQLLREVLSRLAATGQPLPTAPPSPPAIPPTPLPKQAAQGRRRSAGR